MSAPALLVAARTKFLASEQFTLLDAVGTLGSWQIPPEPWVFASSDPRSGYPWQYGAGKSAITFHQQSRQWSTTNTSGRLPTLAVTVWSDGEPGTPDAEWQARNVAEQIIQCFDDPANEHDKQWTDSVRVLSCRWSGNLTVVEVEGIDGLMRADLDFEVFVA